MDIEDDEDFAIFDEETTKTIKDEHEKDMEHAAHVIGARRIGLITGDAGESTTTAGKGLMSKLSSATSLFFRKKTPAPTPTAAAAATSSTTATPPPAAQMIPAASDTPTHSVALAPPPPEVPEKGEADTPTSTNAMKRPPPVPSTVQPTTPPEAPEAAKDPTAAATEQQPLTPSAPATAAAPAALATAQEPTEAKRLHSEEEKPGTKEPTDPTSDAAAAAETVVPEQAPTPSAPATATAPATAQEPTKTKRLHPEEEKLETEEPTGPTSDAAAAVAETVVPEQAPTSSAPATAQEPTGAKRLHSEEEQPETKERTGPTSDAAVVAETVVPELRVVTFDVREPSLGAAVEGHVVILEGSCYVWAGTEGSSAQGSLAAAVGTRFNGGMPTATPLLAGEGAGEAGAGAGGVSVSMAQRLCRRTGRVVFVSCDLSEDSQILVAAVEAKVVALLKAEA
ncbi:unnamed protein product [Pylaiella littoralis]